MEVTIGKRIKARRKALKLTQGELAVLADISRQSLRKHEKDLIIPTDAVIERYASVLEIPFSHLKNGQWHGYNFQVLTKLEWS